MQPGINNDTFDGSRDGQNQDNDRTNGINPDSDNKQNITERNASTDKKENPDHEKNVNDVHDNDKVEKSWDADSKTYNQDEDSWDEEKGEGETTSNQGTPNNNWNANDQTQRSPGRNDSDEETREASADDYIDSNRESYTWNNDRFRWSEPEDEE